MDATWRIVLGDIGHTLGEEALGEIGAPARAAIVDGLVRRLDYLDALGVDAQTLATSIKESTAELVRESRRELPHQ